MTFNYVNFKELSNKYLLNKLKIKYINYDNNYFKNYHNKKYFKVSKIRKRTVLTEYGVLTYSRRIYKNKYNGNIFVPTDIYVGIKPYSRIINEIKNIIINKIGQKKSYKNIQDEFNIYISKTTISNIFKNIKVKEILPQEKIKVKDNEYIYINVDDCFVPVWNKNKKRKLQKIRSISYNTGKKQISKNRNKLLNKKYNFMFNYKFTHDFYQNNPTVESTWKGLIKYYDFYNPKLVVAGDGAGWIKNLAKYLGAYYVFDKYHAISYLKKAYNLESKWRTIISNIEKINNYKISLNYFCNGQYNELIEFLTKTKVNKEILKIFKNNKQGIINQSASWNIGCSAESDIFHLVKSQTKGAKTYNYKTLNNMLISRVNYFNNRI